MAWSLCSKSDVISIHPTTEAALQDFWSDAVEDMIREYLGVPNLGISAAITNELRSGDNTNILIVNQLPILSVTEVLIFGVALNASEYIVTPTGIQLKDRVFPAGTLNVSISYLSGTALDPITNLPVVSPIIRLTASAMIVAIVNYRGRAGADRSIKWGSTDKEEGETTANINVGLTSHLKTIMKRMLRRNRIKVI